MRSPRAVVVLGLVVAPKLGAQPEARGLQPVRIGTPANCGPRPVTVIAMSGGRTVEIQRFEHPCLTIAAVDSITPGGMSAQTLSDALAGRIAGVSVLRSSGVTGSGSRVRIRGGSGLLIPRAPILVIDGVRVDASQSSLGLDIGGQTPSRLDDIPLQEIERITVLRGPASTALYGANGAGGVIVVTTKRGRGVPPQWTSWAEGGVAMDATDYPANSGTGPPTYGVDTCTRAEAALGECTPGPLSRWNPIEQASPFRSARRLGGGASVTGGARLVQYHATGSVSEDQGILAPNDARRGTARVNLDVTPARNLQLALSGSHTASGTTFPVGDAFGTGALQAGLGGNTADDPVLRGYFELAPELVSTLVTEQHLSRSLGSVSGTWTPMAGLTARGLIGRELVWRDDSRTHPMAVAFRDPDREGPWRFEGSTGRDKYTTISGNLTAAYPLARSLRGATTVGAERLTESLRKRDSIFFFFEDGGGAGSARRRSHERRKTVGLFAAHELAWAGRRLFDIGVRRDDGDRLRLLKGATYWSTSASWTISDEPFFRRTAALGALRLRGAYGVGGDTRPARVALDGPFSLPPPGTQPGPVGSVFRPEKVSELELGAEVATWHSRVFVDLTWYRQRSTNALERGCCVGLFSVSDAAGWRTNGLELTATAQLLRNLTKEWDARLTFATFSNRYDRSQGSDRRPVDQLFAVLGRRLARGYPIAGAWGNPATARDANGDGVIVPSEITVGADPVYLGPSIPTRQAGLATMLKLSRNRIRLSLQADYHGGFVSRNLTEEYRCGLSICAALYDANASVADQTRAVLEFGVGTGFTERADFARLRELGVTWVLFPGLMNRYRAGELSLTVAGRNLATITGYSGLDPEVNGAGQASFGTTEFFTLPLPPTLLIRLALQRCSFPTFPTCG